MKLMKELSLAPGVSSGEDEIAKINVFHEASELLDQIFRMNFDYNFMSDYRKAYQIKK